MEDENCVGDIENGSREQLCSDNCDENEHWNHKVTYEVRRIFTDVFIAKVMQSLAILSLLAYLQLLLLLALFIRAGIVDLLFPITYFLNFNAGMVLAVIIIYS